MCSLSRGVALVAGGGLTFGSSALAGSAEDVPIGGYQPQVLFTLTDEFLTENADLFFVAENDTTYNASRALTAPGVASPYFAVGLLDTGAQVNLFRDETANAFGIDVNGFGGTEVIPIGGVAGTELATVEDPLGLFATGLQNRTSPSGGAITATQSTLVGQTSVSPATSGPASALPDVVGLPLASQYTTVIRNSQPQIFTGPDGSTVRSPSVEFDALGTGASQGIARRVGMTLDVSPLIGTDLPSYIFNIGGVINGDPLHDNPSSPTAVAGAFFLDVDYTRGANVETANVFFDSGAQVSVVSETFAASLGFDVVLDEPEFTVPILGAGGTLTEVPGFRADTLELTTVGGPFVLSDVPLVVLDVPNPTGTGAVDGILGTNAFSDRDIVIDPAGDKLWISDDVLETHDWAGLAGSTNWHNPPSWDAPGTPGILWRTNVVNAPGQNQFASISSDSTVHNIYLAGNEAGGTMTLRLATVPTIAPTLTTFAETRVGVGGRLEITGRSILDTTQLEINGGAFEAEFGTVRGAVENRGLVELVGPDFDIVGTYLQDESGRLFVDAANFGPATRPPSQLIVTQSASLAGVLEFSDWVFLLSPGDSAPFLTAEAGISGTFDSVLGAVNDDRMYSLVYGPDTVSIEALVTGDLDGDGFVSQSDLNLILLNWGDTVTAGVAGLGDPSGDGFISQADLNLVLLNWGDGTPPVLSIPEPATSAVVILGVVGLRRRR
ncbi:MAG: aspartyl protease family protein [Planctomycetota bacterium]